MKRSVMLTLIIFLLVLMVFAAKAVKKGPSAATPPAPTVAMEPAATPAPVAQASPDVDEEPPADADAAEPEAADEAQSDRPAPPSSDTPSTPASRPQPDEPASQPAAQAPVAPASANPLPGSALADSLRSGKPTMVDFGAGWCRPCQEQEPILHQAAARYQGKANIVYVDTGEYADLTRQYGIRVIPTQIFFDSQGNEVSRHMGVYPMADIDREFAALGATP